MRFFIFSIFFAILFIAQISIMPYFLISGISFNLMLISAFIFGFFMIDFKELMVFSFLAGFLLDIYSGVPFGIIILSFIASVIVVNFLIYNFLGRENIFIVCIGVAIGFVTYHVLYLGISELCSIFNLSSEIIVSVALFLKAAIFSTTLNVLGAAILYVPLKRFIIFADNFKR